LYIKPQDPIEISTATVEILTMQGQIIASQVATFNWLNRSYAADCSGLAAGLYILRVWIGSQPFSFKLVKI
jgi:hypothetical protein